MRIIFCKYIIAYKVSCYKILAFDPCQKVVLNPLLIYKKETPLGPSIHLRFHQSSFTIAVLFTRNTRCNCFNNYINSA